MNYSYFLGSNSKDGFYSLYDSFPPTEGDFLHILKGGPGSGKSCFMRKIGARAEEMGYTVHYILCSGDPDSLDGVYIPEKKLAFVDGTSPHSREPSIYGVDSDYIHLGQFFKNSLSQEESHYVNQYTSGYKADYSAAYHLLSASVSVSESALLNIYGDEEQSAIKEKICSLLNRKIPRDAKSDGKLNKRFLSCIGCRGDYRLNEEISKLCKLIYQIDDRFGGTASALKYAAEYGEEHGLEMLLCPDPVCPKFFSAVLFPEQSLGLVGSGWEFPQVRHIHMDSILPSELRSNLRSTLRETDKLRKQLMSLAFSQMAEAKRLHDLLEAVYKPHIDFEALNKYTNSCITQYLA